MKNKIIVLSFAFLIIVLLNFDSKKIDKKIKDGNLYAITVDGVVSEDFPNKNLYRVDVYCNNAIGKWSYDNWKLYLENISGNVACDISFTTIPKTNFNNYIIELEGKTQGTGQVVNENGYRYEGKDPNNYVWFNNELWRVIGVFDETSHGQTGKNLTKIIKDESLGLLAIDSGNNNNWKTSSLKNLLNGAYYNRQDGTNSGYCYGFDKNLNCDYSQIGISSSYRSMIKNVTWYLGGISSNSGNSNYYETNINNYYKYERGSIVYNENPKSDVGYIGLMYLSDYGYSVLANNCPRTKNVGNTRTTACTTTWLAGQGDTWSITPNSDSADSEGAIFFDGHIGIRGNANAALNIRPTLYLDESVYVLDGDGSYNDPYIIAMD